MTNEARPDVWAAWTYHLSRTVLADRILRLAKKNRSNSLGEREPGENPGQACCCNGPRNPDKKPLRKREGVGVAEARRPAERDGIVLTTQDPMQPSAPSPYGSRLCPSVREGHDREPLALTHKSGAGP